MKPDKVLFIKACHKCDRLFHARWRAKCVCDPCRHNYGLLSTDGDAWKAELRAVEKLLPELLPYVQGDLIPPGYAPMHGWWRKPLADVYLEKPLATVDAYINAARQRRSG